MAARPLRLLSLDGGGVKGMTSLLILERIFRVIKDETGETPNPHQYFDLIGGTSTGGLIAIMLGRLKMSISECIQVYKSLSERVFAKNWTHKPPIKLLSAGAGKPWFDSKVLEDAVRQLLVDKGMDPELLLREETDPGCKVFVCVTRTHNSQAEIVRSYATQDPSQQDYECRIWEAARATTAAPLFFSKVSLKSDGSTFVDGGLRRNNPIYEIVREANRIYQEPVFGCIVSIGTGWTNPVSLQNSKGLSIIRACVDIALDAQERADEFRTDDFGGRLWKAKKYFRFNVEQGMQVIQMEEYKEMEKMAAMTSVYLSRQGEEIRECVKSLSNPTTPQWLCPHKMLSILPRDPNPNFTGREAYLRSIEATFRKSEPFYQRVLLWGLGGVGKSQIALKYAERHSSGHSTFWVKADSKTNLIQDMGRIGKVLKLDVTSAEGAIELLYIVRDALEATETGPWLMILDGADDPGMFLDHSEGGPAIVDFIPRASHGRTLVTSRTSQLAGLADGRIVPAHNGIHVESMSEEEGVALLKRSIPVDLYNQSKDSTTETCKELIEVLGGLPLALSQAAAFIRNDRVPLNDFLDLYQGAKDHSEMFRYPAYSEDKEQQSVLLTWEISYARIGGRDPPASKSASATLLDYMGFFHPQVIPQSLLRIVYEKYVHNDGEPFLSAVGHLLSYCLVYQNPGYEEYWIHPVVHEWIRRRLDDTTRREAVCGISTELNSLFHVVPFAYDTVNTKPPSPQGDFCSCQVLQHGISIIDWATDLGISNDSLGELSGNLAMFFITCGIHDVAIALAEVALKIAVKSGSSRSIVHRRLLLAGCLLNAADPIRALSEASACVDLSPDFPIEPLYFVAEALRLQERTEDAEEAMRQILDFRVKQDGESSDLVAITKHYIVHTLAADMAKLKLDEARFHYAVRLNKESLEVLESLHRQDTIIYLVVRRQLADLKAAMGDIESARNIEDDVLKASVRICGRDHDYTRHFALRKMTLLSVEGQYAELERLCREFVSMEPGQAQGRQLIQDAHMRNMLGVALQYQGRARDAEGYHRSYLDTMQEYAGNIRLAKIQDLDIAVYNLAGSLARQQKGGEVDQLMKKYPESWGRLEAASQNSHSRLVTIADEVLEASIRMFGRHSVTTLQFALWKLFELRGGNHYGEMELLCRDFITQEPEQSQTKALVQYGHICNLLGMALHYQGRAREAEGYHRSFLEIVKPLVGKSDLVTSGDVDLGCYNVALSLARQQADGDVEKLRNEYPGCIERSEVQYGTLASRIEANKEGVGREEGVTGQASKRRWMGQRILAKITRRDRT